MVYRVADVNLRIQWQKSLVGGQTQGEHLQRHDMTKDNVDNIGTAAFAKTCSVNQRTKPQLLPGISKQIVNMRHWIM